MQKIKNEENLRMYVREFLTKTSGGGSGLVKGKTKGFDVKSESFLDLHNAIKKGDHTNPDKKARVEELIRKVKADLASLRDDMGKVRNS